MTNQCSDPTIQFARASTYTETSLSILGPHDGSAGLLDVLQEDILRHKIN
jgi:hypothetical protein